MGISKSDKSTPHQKSWIHHSTLWTKKSPTHTPWSPNSSFRGKKRKQKLRSPGSSCIVVEHQHPPQKNPRSPGSSYRTQFRRLLTDASMRTLSFILASPKRVIPRTSPCTEIENVYFQHGNSKNRLCYKINTSNIQGSKFSKIKSPAFFSILYFVQ